VNPLPGVITGPPCSLRDINRGPDPSGWASLESETVKYGPKSRGTRTRECSFEKNSGRGSQEA
jgi:hypothetical protein